MQIEIRNYDKVTGYAGRRRVPMIDNITEYTFTTCRKLNEDGMLELLKQEGQEVYGQIKTFVEDFDIDVWTMAKVFKYTVQAIMY